MNHKLHITSISEYPYSNEFDNKMNGIFQANFIDYLCYCIK